MTFQPVPPRPHSTWMQPSFIPPEVVRIDFTWFADVHMDRMQLGWTISEGTEEQCVAMEVLAWRGLTDGFGPFLDAVAVQIREQLARLVPFP